MNPVKPPRLAAWILQYFGPEFNQEALAGDLNEAFQQGRSKAWYWRQVLAAVRWRRLIYTPLVLVAWSWAVTWPGVRENLPMISRLQLMAIVMAVFLAFWSVLALLRGQGVLRAVFRVVVILIFFLLFRLSGILMLLIWNFAFLRKVPGPYQLKVRELVFGDPGWERQRLMEKLHLAMVQEADPQVRQAYAEAIADLKAHAAPVAKATQ